MVENEFIDFNEIRKTAGIFDKEQFSEYLKEVYKDLFNRSSTNNKTGISKISFVEYLKIPIFICEKLFSSFDKDKDGYLNFHEFHSNFFALYQGSFEQTLKIIFNVLDFNKDDWIEKGDVKLLLSHLPLSTIDDIKIVYNFQMESLDEIDEIIKKTFEDKEKLSYPQFKSIVINRKSDIYFQLLLFFYQSKPFENAHIKMIKSKKSFKIESDEGNNNQVNSPMKGMNNQIKIRSPNKKTKLSPVANFFNLNLNGNNKNELIPINTQMVRLPNAIVRDEQKHSTMAFTSPTNYFKDNSKLIMPKNKISDFNLMDNLVTINEENTNKSQTKETLTDVIYEDWVLKNDNGTMNNYYLVLVDNAFYSYKDDKKEELLSINNLSGCFIKEKGESKIKSTKYYSFILQYPGKTTNYYCETKEIMKIFTSSFKQAIKYQNFFDYYEMIDDINEGKFGIVKLGIHKRTNQNVAIKIIKKEIRKQDEIEMIKNEIDIMKLCYHPNVVHLLDHFENVEYIFIVMEYLKGGNLESFIKANKHRVPEKIANKFIAQIANGLHYLHQFGIVHRDLKPENILLSDNTENAQAKIMDFGLSKVLGPNEKVIESYGTLAFVAPEVLLRIPYDTQIDIWSLGIIIYYMLSGKLPFDCDNCTEEEMAKMTVYNEVKFNNEEWSKVSKEGLDLIRKCLNKDPNKRIKINEFLKSDWFKMNEAKRK